MDEFQETRADLVTDLRIGADRDLPRLDVLVRGRSTYIRDLRVNIKNALASEHLSAKETALIAYAIVVNDKNELLMETFAAIAQEQGAGAEEVAEMAACASLLAVNNVFYRFRHFVGKDSYQQMPGRIKMNIMMRPVTGKMFFELVSLAVSAVNGCEACVKSHEQSVLHAGATEAQVFDAIRLAAIVVGLTKLVS